MLKASSSGGTSVGELRGLKIPQFVPFVTLGNDKVLILIWNPIGNFLLQGNTDTSGSRLEPWKGYFVEAGEQRPLNAYTDAARPRTIGPARVIGGLLLHATRK